jgi:hypothetical protein
MLPGLTVSCILILTACADESTIVSSRPPTSSSPAMNAAPAVSAQRPVTYDDELEQLVDEIPGFGGWFVDANGIPTIQLKDIKQRGLAERVLAQRLAIARQSRRPDGSSIAAMVQVRPAAFDFRELRGWGRVAERLLDSEPSAVYVDVNEQTNHVEIGVSDAAGAARINAALRDNRVPYSAVEVLVTPTPHATQGGATILDNVRPLPGGVYIVCTLGVNANRGGVLGFVTNSHCTNVFASAASPRQFWQGGDPLGEETYDPAPWQFTSDCQSFRNLYPGGLCRYSDAAFADYRYFPSASVDFGYIARTTYVGYPIGQMGSFTINQSNRHFEVVGKYYSIPVGVYVYRVAAASGWTLHNTSSACTTEYVQATSLGGVPYKAKLWCQYRTGGGSRYGDSGGPIFASFSCAPGQPYRPDGTECVWLAGINWGEVDGVHRTLFSPISGVEADLGALGVRPIDRPY